MFNQFHLIKNKNVNLAFHVPTSTIIRINDYVYHIFEKLQQGKNINDISKEFKINSNTLNSFLKKIYDSIPIKISVPEFYNKNRIGRITLHISNSCNLRCTYCYANGGNYNQKEKLMSKQTAIDFVNFFSNQFDKIGNIVFFGGEPLLNINVIEIIAEKFLALQKNNKIKEIPTFGMITNGTILNDHILAILKKYISFITVSIDGKKEINDKNRIYPDGSGSFDKIANFIRTIKKNTNIFIKYEATYTTEHLKLNIKKKDIADYLLNEFGIKGSIVDDINIQTNTIDIPNKNNNNQNNHLIDDSSFLNDGLINILSAIVHNSYREMCPVGSNIVSVSVDGDIYPCHMNVGEKKLRLGSIYDDNIFNKPNLFRENFPYLNILNKEKEPCKSCWLQRLCGGCTVLWYYDNNEVKYNDKPNKKLCEKNKKYIENIILEIAEIKNDKEKWSKFLYRLKNIKQDDTCVL